MADSIDLFDLDLVKDDPETFTMLMNAHVADLETNYTLYTKEAEKTRAQAIENAGSSPSEETLQDIELAYRADCAEGMRNGFDNLAQTKYGITGLELQERVTAAGVQYEIREDWIPQPVIEQPEQQSEKTAMYADLEDGRPLKELEQEDRLRAAFDDAKGDSTHQDSRLVYDGDRVDSGDNETAGTPHVADSHTETTPDDESHTATKDQGYEPDI
jgi:hypothetical protein